MALDKRRVFEMLRKKYFDIGKGNIRLSESSLVLIQPISTSKAAYNFPALNNEMLTPLVNEIRLNMNDEFTAVSLGIYLGGYWRNAANTAGTGGFQLMSYAPMELSGTCASLLPLWDGTFSFGANNVTFLEKWRIKKHNFVPEVQFATQPIPAAGPPVISNSFPATMPDLDYSRDGMVDLNATITLSGAKKNAVDIQLPTALTPRIVTFYDQTAVPVINYANLDYIVIVMDGFLAQNGAKFQGAGKQSDEDLR